MLSRSLFLPGELPAMTHLGATLLRHCLQAAVRYGRYHLGLAVPIVPKMPIVHLRPYFEGDVDDPFDDMILDPGSDRPPELSRRTSAALSFHALRLRLLRWSRAAGDEPTTGSSGWPLLRRRVSAWVPALGDGLLLDLVAVRRRRRARHTGKTRPPCSSRRLAAWLEAPQLAGVDVGVAPSQRSLEDRIWPDPDPPRGALRDAWVEAALDLRSLVADLATEAAQRGLISTPEDAFFVPFDLLDVLEREVAPAWLAGTIDSNRAEWVALAESRAPAERLEAASVGLRLASRSQTRSLPPILAPLP